MYFKLSQQFQSASVKNQRNTHTISQNKKLSTTNKRAGPANS